MEMRQGQSPSPTFRYGHWWPWMLGELTHNHRLAGQHFGDGIHHQDLHDAHQRLTRSASVPGPYRRDWGIHAGPKTAIVKEDRSSFHVSLDVQHFAPEEISVKVTDRSVIVEGKHDDKKDEHGIVSRQFCRRYEVPEDCDIDHVQSKLSSDGVLSIIVPRKVEGERSIPIVHTGKPAVLNTPKESSSSTPETKVLSREA